MLNPFPPSFQLYAFPGSPLTAVVSSDPLQSNGTVTGKTDGPIFKVVRISALALEWVFPDPGEVGGGGGRFIGRPVLTQQWVVVATSDGVTPLHVSKGQSLLVEMQGVAPASTPAGGVTEHLNVKTGIPGDDFSVPLTLEVGQVVPFLEPAYNASTPMPITFGQSAAADWAFDWKLGPPVGVSFRMDTVDTSGFITGNFSTAQPVNVQSGNPFGRINFTLVVNTSGILQINSKHTVFMWMTLRSQAGGQTIQTLPIFVVIT
jgi:hypothetical protein